ncbi:MULTISPECIES: pilus assembly protein [Ramlibacter]|uniref:Pilus assembly protein n=1 Tax=Ramlibacter pinisoli TaxID=2682844 RepID=A0A6N8IYD4_9BURK|nr:MULTISPECIES: pilus assembly protein [Ramlibacter]MBA2961846.1 pilus assembly protein [Ramlibacter sp. CGMCC 1.13660]MVQ31788.1 pilus assembly protein [Ramlibacter pinisoli]
MRKLDFDFQREPSPSPWGWALLLVGIACVAGVLEVQLDHGHQQEDQGARWARLQAAGGPGAQLAAADARDGADLIAARKVLERSQLPWDSLFAALEATDQADVALLAVVPDVLRRQVKIHAEARTLGSMLQFHRQLQQQPGLAQVVLVDHAIATDAVGTPVRFHISASWGVAHASP